MKHSVCLSIWLIHSVVDPSIVKLFRLHMAKEFKHSRQRSIVTLNQIGLMDIITVQIFQELTTHICLVDSSILTNWTSPFLILEVSGILFSFLFYFE